MRWKEMDLPRAATILVAVGDGVLADSLRFSLELEGFDVRLCEEHSLLRAMDEAEAPRCLVIDHGVFVRLVDGKIERGFAGMGFPVILMAGYGTDRVVARARQAGVTHVVEQPLLGPVLLDAISAALSDTMPPSHARRPS